MQRVTMTRRRGSNVLRQGIAATAALPTVVLTTLLTVLLTGAVALGIWASGIPPAQAQAPSQTPTQVGGLVVQAVTASPEKIAAAGGESRITVSVSGDFADSISSGASVTLSTTLGAFGSANGPNQIVLSVVASSADEGEASTALFGDGRWGTAAVTARVGASARSVVVIFVGETASIQFEQPSAGAVFNAETRLEIIVQVRDAGGFTVPESLVILRTSSGGLAETDAADAAALPAFVLRSDTNGRVRAYLHSSGPGAVTLQATSGRAERSLAILLHGAPSTLDLIALRSSVNLEDWPFPAPAGTLVAILLDDGGRPIPGRLVTYHSDVAGVSVIQNGTGESMFTDADGRASAHVSAASATDLGPVHVTARAAELEASVDIQVAGPAATVSLEASLLTANRYRIVAQISDSAGTGVPSGHQVRFSVEGRAGETGAEFSPEIAEVWEGVAEATLTLQDGAAGVSVRVTVLGLSSDLSAAAVLPLETGNGVQLMPGLNTFTWTGTSIGVREAVAAIPGIVMAAWLFSPEQGWLGYFPAPDIGVNFELVAGGLVYIYAITGALLPIP